MSFKTKQSDWCVATKDIKCYKWLGTTDPNFDNCIFYTLHSAVYVPMKAIRGKSCFKAEGRAVFKPEGGLYDVSAGTIHAYASEECARENMIRNRKTIALFECIIPEGTKYAVGVDGGVYTKEIKFIKILN